jgi:hypothetical protein
MPRDNRFCGVEFNFLFIAAFASDRNMCGADIPDQSNPVQPVNRQEKKAKINANSSIRDQGKDSAFIKS